MITYAGQSNPVWHYAAGRWPGSVGILLGPAYYRKQALKPWFPLVLDNDRFTCWSKGAAWDEALWREMLRWAVPHKPQWVLVPDVVGDRDGTLRDWEKFSPVVRSFGFPTAFAVQDGMTPADVPDAEVVFIGGTTEWKWANVKLFCAAFPRVHVGRVNSVPKLDECKAMGAESTDGTGWFRDPSRQDKLPALLKWLDKTFTGCITTAPNLNTKTEMKTQHGIPESSSSSLPVLSEPNPVGSGQVPVLHSDRAHSKISPSKLASREICPGFLDDESQPVHPVTLRGTAMHEACESGDDSNLDDAEKGLVKMCRDYVEHVAHDQFNSPPRWFHEVRLDIIDGMWGFADLILLSKNQQVAALIDFKFAFNKQADTETNPAAQAYVLGMFQKWPDLDTIHVHYLYPRREEISKHTYTRKDVPMIRLRIQTIVDRVRLANAAMSLPEQSEQLTPVPDNCQWCARKATCTALHRMVLPLATRYAGRHDISLVQPDFSAISRPEDWAKLLPYTSVLEQMADSIKRHALEFREQTGQEIPGYELRSRQGKKKIINADVAYKVASEFGVTHDQFMRCVDVSAKQLTDVVKENASRGDKAKVAGAMESSLRDAGVLESGGETFFLARSRA